MEQSLFPPAIIKSHDATVEALEFELSATLEKADQFSTKSIALYRESGEILIKIKEKLGKGKWGVWLKRHALKIKKSERQIRRWIALAQVDAGVHLEAAWSIICGHKDDDLEPVEETPVTTTAPPVPPTASSVNPTGKQCRDHRTGKKPADPNCPDCRAMNAPATNGQSPPTPSIPPPAAWSTSTPTPDEAPPAEGEDNAQVKEIDRAIRNASKLAQEILRREVDPKAVQKAQDALKRTLNDLRPLANAPVKPCEPRAAKCKDCGRDCLWVVTANAKIMLVEAEKSYRGKYNIQNGIAHYVEWAEDRKWELYQMHTQNCPKRKKK